MRRCAFTLFAGLALLAAPSASAKYEGRGDPVVIDGASLTKLSGKAAGDIVAFRHRDPKRGKSRWRQLPVQLDERKLVDFGSEPPSNDTSAADETVYGTAAIGQQVLQYADPGTFVGVDPVAGLDGDDEVALMASDAGDKARRRAERPKHTRGASETRVKISDPLGGPAGFVYLFAAKRALPIEKDYVRYSFNLTSGDYKTTYRRAAGPNPETSTIDTETYSIGFSDRWYYDALAIKAPGASGVDILDGFKFTFGPTSCGRSEATFNAAEGAFVANIDGPVRAIRSYVGANSGPLTERTHIFYSDRHQLTTDLRVHAVPGPLTYHDLSASGIGMTYINSANPAGVTVDGVPDSVSDDVAQWHQWTGAQGSLFSADRLESSFKEQLEAGASNWYLDDSTPAPNVQCWGDQVALGQAGLRSTYSMPNTDPRTGGTDFLSSTTTDIVSGPGASAADASLQAQRLDSPLTTVVKP